MTKWPVGGSVADRPEGVLQNGKENLDWQRLYWEQAWGVRSL